MRAFLDIFLMWRNTRMIVLVAISAAFYAAILIPFKLLPLIPGYTEVRPASAIPPACAILFGPAGAWGSAIGNLVGDVMGTIGPGSIAGFFGNFAFGFLPYVIWKALGGKTPFSATPRNLIGYCVGTVFASLVCALIISPVVVALGAAPFQVIFGIIMFNNVVFGCFLGIPLLLAVYKRVQALGLTYPEVMTDRAEMETESDLDE